jgi:hypothetical protein
MRLWRIRRFRASPVVALTELMRSRRENRPYSNAFVEPALRIKPGKSPVADLVREMVRDQEPGR